MVALGAAAALGAGCGGGGGASSGSVHGDGPGSRAPIVINELLAANVLTNQDDHGAAPGWLELFNPTAADVALDGYALTDDLSQPRKAPLAAGLALPAGGYLVIWCDGSSPAAGAHAGVTLSRAGGAIALARPDGSFADALTYGAQAVDMSAAREPDGAATWAIEWHVSPGAANPGQPPAGAVPVTSKPEAVPAATDVSARAFDDGAVAAYELQVDDAGIASLRAQPATFVKATLIYQGRAYGPVGVNLKGTASFLSIDSKPAFRVHVDEFVKGARFFDLKSFYLNNMSTDRSMMHERMAYWAAAQAGGVPAARAHHVTVTLNGQPLGLYMHVEEPRKEMLARFFSDASGSSFTIHYADFQAAYLSGFQLQDGPDDLSVVQALTADLAMQPADAALAAAGRHCDLHQLARYWALMVVLGHWGAWPYAATAEPVGANAGLYVDPSSGRINFIMEGPDDTFYTAELDFLGPSLKSVLPATCKAVPSCFNDFKDQVWEILGKLEQADWAAVHDVVAAQIAPYVPADTRKPYPDADVAQYQRDMRGFITGRRQVLGASLPPPGP